ncbi:MAG: VOC family protein [Pseudomonadota bacterium]
MSAPIIAIDHVQIDTADFDRDVENMTELFGFAAHWHGGSAPDRRAIYTTANLQVVLREGETSGLVSVAFLVDDMQRIQRRLKRVGIEFSAEDDTDLLNPVTGDASMVTCAAQSVRGLGLHFIQRSQPPRAKPTVGDERVTGLDHVVVASSDAERTAFLLGAQLGLDMRMDRSNPDWGARLLFFRCGDLIVEVFQPLDDKERDTSIDGFYGLSWRVGNADGAQRRLSAAGRDVSEVRKGRKPGTKVFTSREGNAGVPTLLIEPAA